MGLKPRPKRTTALQAVITRYQQIRARANEIWEIYEGEPNPTGAADSAIAALQKKFGEPLPSDYVEFLRAHDGWEGYEYDRILMSVAEVVDDAAAESLEINLENIDEEVADALADVFVIGCDNGTATVLYIDRADGSIVEYYCEETGRWPSLTAYFEELAADLERSVADELESQKDACADWEPEVRRAKYAAYRSELDQRFAKTPGAALALTAADRAAIEASLAHVGSVPASATDLNQAKLRTHLAFTGYMLYVPTAEEVTRAARLFREHFPWSQRTLACAPSDEYNKKTIEPGTTDFSDFLKVQSGGHFGLRMVDDNGRTKTSHIFNFRGAPEWHGEPIASFLEVLLPADADANALRAFTLAVADAIPITHGYAGYAALPLNSNFVSHMKRLHGWCRAHWGLQIAYVDELLPLVLRGLHGVSWLTLLDRDSASLVTMPSEHGIEVHERTHATVIQAGPEPSLGDVRVQYPHAMATVHNALRPLFAPGISELRHFDKQGATQAWWHRFERPAEFALSPDDVLIEIDEAAKASDTSRLRAAWAQLEGREPAARECLRDRLSELAHSLLRTSDDVAVVLYDWLTTMESPRLHDLNNALVAVWTKPDEAGVFIERALPFGERNPSIFHNVMGLYVEHGHVGRAIEIGRTAAPHYTIKLLQLLESDEDFAPLLAHPDFAPILAAMKQRLMPSSSWAPLARNHDLERKVGANHDDVAVHHQYAAWLTARGDPRGAFIEAQIAEAESPRDKSLRKRSRTLLAEYIRNRLQSRFADLAEHFDKDVFRWGLLHTLYMSSWPERLHPRGLELLADPECRLLRRLHLKKMRVDLEHVAASVPYLRQLNLRGAQFESLEPVAELAQLDELVLTQTTVTDLSALGQMPNLRKLYLESTEVTDLSPIARLPRLEFINLEGSAVIDIEPLAQLPRLCELWLYKTKIPKQQAERFEQLIKSRDIEPGPGVTTMVYGP